MTIKKQLGRKQHGLVSRLLKSINKNVSDNLQITRHDVSNFQRKHRVRDGATSNALDLENGDSLATINETGPVIRGKGGRPKGSTAAKKRDFDTAMVAARNEIAAIYDKEKKVTWPW